MRSAISAQQHRMETVFSQQPVYGGPSQDGGAGGGGGAAGASLMMNGGAPVYASLTAGGGGGGSLGVGAPPPPQVPRATRSARGRGAQPLLPVHESSSLET
jgi:hypothetical protein